MKCPRNVAVAMLCGLLLAGMAMPAAADERAEQAPATQLRVALDRVLSEHAFLIVQVMRTGLTPGPEFDAAAAALDANTNELVAAIRSVYGTAAGDAFAEQWRNHIAFLVDYARALSANNTSAAQLADSQLNQYVTTFSALLAGAVELPEAAVAGLIREHVEQLEQVASFKSSNFGAAYPAILQTYDHMFMIGDALAGAIIAQSPDRFSGRDFAFSPATDLRLQIDRLLGAHTELAALAMRARLSDASDVDASVVALNQNTADLTAAIASIYGDAAGAAFEQQWRDHTDFYLAYVAAKKANDSSAQATALDGLSNYQTTFTAFLVKANPLLSEPRFRELIGEHTHHILSEADQYAADSFSPAYETERAAFQHSGVLSAYLAGAIADQFPNRFPNTSIDGGVSPLTLIGVGLIGIAALAYRPRHWRVEMKRR